MEKTTSFVMNYSFGVGNGKSKVRGAPQMDSSYERECWVKGCRGVGVMRPRGEGIQKLPISEAFHKNCKLNLLFILILEDRCVIYLLRVSLFRSFYKTRKNGMK